MSPSDGNPKMSRALSFGITMWKNLINNKNIDHANIVVLLRENIQGVRYPPLVLRTWLFRRSRESRKFRSRPIVTTVEKM